MEDGYIVKGKVLHRTKRTANATAMEYRASGIPCRITKLAKGYRVDRKF